MLSLSWFGNQVSFGSVIGDILKPALKKHESLSYRIILSVSIVQQLAKARASLLRLLLNRSSKLVSVRPAASNSAIARPQNKLGASAPAKVRFLSYCGSIPLSYEDFANRSVCHIGWPLLGETALSLVSR